MTTTQRTDTPRKSDRGPFGVFGVIGLMSAWFLFAMGETLYGDLDGADSLAPIADASGRFAAGALLELLGAVMLVPGIVLLIGLTRQRAPMLSQVGGWLALAGTVGLGAFVQVHLLQLAMTDPALDRAALDGFMAGPLQEGGLWTIPIALVLLPLPIGLLLLAAGAARAGITSRWPALLIGTYIVVHLGIANEWTEVGSHYLLAVVLLWIGLSILRHRVQSPSTVDSASGQVLGDRRQHGGDRALVEPRPM